MGPSGRRAGFILVAAIAVLSTVPSWAVEAVPLSRELAQDLAGPVRAGEHVVVPRLTLEEGSVVSLDLEAIDVFRPDAEIVEFASGGSRRVAPPTDRYFRGVVIGDVDSAVMIAIGATLRGLVITNGKVYAVGPDRNVYTESGPQQVSSVRRVDPLVDRPATLPTFRCEEETLPPIPADAISALVPAGEMVVRAMSTNTVYSVNLALETDYEFYQLFGSTDGALRFIGDLTATASAIYWRDVKTVFQIGTLHLYSSTAAPYPWAGYGSTSALLYGLGDYWHANYPKASVPRTTVHMLSGKNLGGGIAWLNVLCANDFQFQVCDSNGQNCVNHYGGGYGVSSSLSASFSTTNPSLYWDVLCYTHEIGHNFSSPHTHCYSPPVDHCYNSESGCYSGSLCQNGTSDPCNIGTIMSYCHLRSGGYSNITLVFGQQGQASQAVTDKMRAYVEALAACLGGLAAAPSVTGVSPSAGSTAGGTVVTLTGTGFQSYGTVTIGGVRATCVTVTSSTKITATTGAHAAATVDVVVQNPDSQTATKSGGYVYTSVPAPVVTSISPVFGSASGGTAVTLQGSHFVAGATVAIGGSPAAVGTVTGTSISATTTSHAPGVVDVVVTNPDTQTGTLVSGYEYRVSSEFYPVTPCRVVDTRISLDPAAVKRGKVADGETRAYTFSASTDCPGLPGSAKAWSMNVQYRPTCQTGSVVAYPDGVERPTVTTLVASPDRWRVNNTIVPAGSGGTIDVYCEYAGNIVMDVNGYFK